jgi:hypothetical protein
VRQLRKIAFLCDGFAPQTAAQQLLDRFLIGYPHDGEIHRLDGCKISLHTPNGESNAELQRRQKDFELLVESDLGKALSNADAMVIVCSDSGAVANEPLLKDALQRAPIGCACFVHGVLANSSDGAAKIIALARSRQVSVLGGLPTSVTWRLPEVEVAIGTPLREALIVVQGASPVAELNALEGLLPLAEHRRGGESGVRGVWFLEGDELWQAGERGKWSKPLLAAAISRSNTPQGDPIRDGRTQDLVGLGLVSKLASNPRGWIIEHRDGFRSAILVLDGVVADFNFAVLVGDGRTLSAQLYRPPAPADHYFSRMTEVMEGFFRNGKPPWPIERNRLIAGLLAVFAKRPLRSGQRIETPELHIAYKI